MEGNHGQEKGCHESNDKNKTEKEDEEEMT